MFVVAPIEVLNPTPSEMFDLVFLHYFIRNGVSFFVVPKNV